MGHFTHLPFFKQKYIVGTIYAETKMQAKLLSLHLKNILYPNRLELKGNTAINKNCHKNSVTEKTFKKEKKWGDMTPKVDKCPIQLKS